ncbi:UDP-N-acetylmuramoyl-L-alanine--D-glutamate ligase [Candidatus Ichthyocystis sparus]|uniref:UDP-N-acetylmuramoyl-L-alanine--D-glutamate ligase n=1 Tax=Candidatus Ichthyocystis sparus TaxID=1561004 RepID=UPI000A9C8D8D|nr:UDP-N-acetylmuramoyl-L-alanine--D-glutamate ligase [Candidatus Ichthyocystis sparus]
MSSEFQKELFFQSSFLSSLVNQRVVIVGLGASGLSMVRFLYPYLKSIIIMDSRSEPPCYHECRCKFPEVAVQCGSISIDIDSVDLVCLSPGVSRNSNEIRAIIESGIPVVGDIELFAQINPQNFSKIVAITGSNGKSTTVSLVSHLLEFLNYSCVAVGNIGKTVLDFYLALEKLSDWPNILVIELSSFQLENTFSLHSDVSLILNIVPDHIDYHGDFLSYVNAKSRIYNHSSKLVVNSDDSNVAKLVPYDRPTISYSISDITSDFTVRSNRVFCHGREVGDLSLFSLTGSVNYSNLLASLSIGYALFCDEIFSSVPAWSTFVPLPHRFNHVSVCQDVNFYNDSKATNVGATLASLQNFNGRVILLLGGVAKGQDFSSLRDAVACRARIVFVFGQDALCIINALCGVVPIVRVNGIREAVDSAWKYSLPGDTILFAPACASFDQFSSYEDRGAFFCQCVHVLLGSLLSS